MEWLKNRDYPGNVRELRNLIERVVISTDSQVIHFSHLVAIVRPLQKSLFAPPTRRPEVSSHSEPSETPAPTPPPKEESFNLAALEEGKLQQALAASNGNKSAAAAMVGLSRTAFYRRLEKYRKVE